MSALPYRPAPTPISEPFWSALAEHRVCVQYSPSADQWIFYPRVLAPGTLAADLEWRDISGAGRVLTFAVSRYPTAAPWAERTPQILAVVEWDEGPHVATELVGVEPEAVTVGMRVGPVFEDHPDEGITLLKYRPADD